MRKGDLAMVMTFDTDVDLLADFTEDRSRLDRAINRAQINAPGSSAIIAQGPFPTSGSGGTNFFDAVYLAAHDKLRQEAGRKILVLLTDGGDQGSQETLKTATEAAQKANTIVYVILIADRGFYGGGGFGINLADTGARDMERLASETGGRVINVGNNGKKLEEAFQQIQDELRTQYLASYTPTNPKIDGTFRTLNITCQPGQKVQARKGYYAMADALDPDQ
jgi:VWFA-related protein